MAQLQMSSRPDPGSIDVIWGVAGIAETIGRTERQAYHLLASGALPAKRVGGRWCASRRELEAFFTTSPREVA